MPGNVSGSVTWRIDRGLLVAPPGRGSGWLKITVTRPEDPQGDEGFPRDHSFSFAEAARLPIDGVHFDERVAATFDEEFKVKRNAGEDWEVELEAKPALDVAVQRIVFQPGAYRWVVRPDTGNGLGSPIVESTFSVAKR